MEPPPSVTVRAATPDDRDPILAVVRAAFGTDGRDGAEEVDIVRTTWAMDDAVRSGDRANDDRATGPVIPDGLELVAVDDGSGEVVGHVLSALATLDGRQVPAIAPLAVAPAHQGAGVGSALMTEVVRRADAGGFPLLVLLGNPAYYGRFGFEPAGPLGIVYPPAGAGSPYFQACRLRAYDSGWRGAVTYCWERRPIDIGDDTT
ncbi:MAG TPA: N-acetyltransferase [Acidimicrobiales bacterium]|nr:N-acetyltransferase [Acidimicrobiales bacterium]